MAGLYDRMKRTGLDGFGSDRVNIHLISESFAAYVGNVFTKQQIIDGVNAELERNNSQPLRQEDLSDLDDIIDVIDNRGTTTGKIVYGLSHVSPLFLAAELELVTDQQWRNALEIA